MVVHYRFGDNDDDSSSIIRYSSEVSTATRRPAAAIACLPNAAGRTGGHLSAEWWRRQSVGELDGQDRRALGWT